MYILMANNVHVLNTINIVCCNFVHFSTQHLNIILYQWCVACPGIGFNDVGVPWEETEAKVTSPALSLNVASFNYFVSEKHMHVGL